MLSLACCLLAGLTDDGIAGARYLAMPKAPAFYDEAGHALRRSKIVFHALRFIKAEGNGKQFRLDDGSLVRCRARGVFGGGTLPLLTSSNALLYLQRQYLHRPLWTFGSWLMVQAPLYRNAPPGPTGWPRVGTKPGESLKVEAIYELERAPVVCGAFGYKHNSLPLEFSIDQSLLDARKGSRIFLFVYGSRSARGESRKNSERFSAPFNIFVGSWFLPQAFSTSSPSKETRRAIAKYLASESSQHPYLPRSHSEAAWVYGWPMEDKPLSEILKEQRWSDNESYNIAFEGGKVKSAYWK